jgi:hypothetical protein
MNVPPVKYTVTMFVKKFCLSQCNDSTRKCYGQYSQKNPGHAAADFPMTTCFQRNLIPQSFLLSRFHISRCLHLLAKWTEPIAKYYVYCTAHHMILFKECLKTLTCAFSVMNHPQHMSSNVILQCKNESWTLWSQQSLTNHGFQAFTGLIFYPVLPATVFVFMYPWFFICACTEKSGGFQTKDPHLLGAEV